LNRDLPSAHLALSTSAAEATLLNKLKNRAKSRARGRDFLIRLLWFSILYGVICHNIVIKNDGANINVHSLKKQKNTINFTRIFFVSKNLPNQVISIDSSYLETF
jgi:hypothetical protein